MKYSVVSLLVASVIATSPNADIFSQRNLQETTSEKKEESKATEDKKEESKEDTAKTDGGDEKKDGEAATNGGDEKKEDTAKTDGKDEKKEDGEAATNGDKKDDDKTYEVKGDGYKVTVNTENGYDIHANVADDYDVKVKANDKDGVQVNADLDGIKANARMQEQSEFNVEAGDAKASAKMSEERSEFNAQMDGSGASVTMSEKEGIDARANMGDDYDIKVKATDEDGGKLTTEMKFDKYYMYGMDTNSAKTPECNTGTAAECEKITGSKEYCCAKVVMTDEKGGQQSAMYRCMNQQIVDGASISVSINGASIAMQCSTSAKIIGAFVASSAALMASLY